METKTYGQRSLPFFSSIFFSIHTHVSRRDIEINGKSACVMRRKREGETTSKIIYCQEIRSESVVSKSIGLQCKANHTIINIIQLVDSTNEGEKRQSFSHSAY